MYRHANRPNGEYYAVSATGDSGDGIDAPRWAYLERSIGDAPGLPCRDRG